MKKTLKIFSVILAIIFALSTAVTAFAADLDSETETAIKKAIYTKFYENDDYYSDIAYEDIYFEYIGTTSDGSICFWHPLEGAWVQVSVTEIIGAYAYSYTPGSKIYLYIDGVVYEIKEAYNSGIISKDTLAELAEMDVLSPLADENGLADSIMNSLQQEIYFKYEENNASNFNDIEIQYVGSASDGSFYVTYTVAGKEKSDEIVEYTMGNYTYSVNADNQVYCCTQEEDSGIALLLNVCTIQEAYDSGIISDGTLAELAEMDFGLVKNSSEVTAVMGDANGDGVITVADVTVIQKASVKLTALTDEQSELADVNGDGRVSVLDATCIQKYVVGGYSDTGSTGQTVSK